MNKLQSLLLQFLLALLLQIPVLPVCAQVKLNDDFRQTLEAAQLQYFSPLEDFYKSIRLRKNQILECDMAIRSRNKKLEIRYAIKMPGISPYPHINSLSLATSVASNEKNTAVAVHTISPEELDSFYNADWGAVFYFKPKREFSTKSFCKMLALYAEDKATVYVFYLFDKANEEIEHQAYSFRFEE